MKRLILICNLLTTVLMTGAQRYMRYHMNDNTFNGFYTNYVDSILHGTEFSQVYANGQVYEILLENVDSITFEGTDIVTDADDMVGRFRIYEYEVSPTDSMYNIYKKAYFDNRALLMTSKTGEFGANDTIIIHSEFYDCDLLLLTNDDGNISRVFNGEYLLDILYQEDGDYTVNLLDSSCDSILMSEEFSLDVFEKYSITRGWIKKTFREAIKGLKKVMTHKSFEKFRNKMKGTFLEESAFKTIEVVLDALSEIETNPELKNEKIVLDFIQVGADITGIGFTAIGGALTGGQLWAALGVEIGLFSADFEELYNDIFPSTETLEKYKKFYADKYLIKVHAEEAVNISDVTATLDGTLWVKDGINGIVFFHIEKVSGNEGWDIMSIVIPITDYLNKLSANIIDLEPNTEYKYFIKYVCEIDGMEFIYESDVKWFTTKAVEQKNTIETLDATDIGINFATLNAKVIGWDTYIAKFGFCYSKDSTTLTIENSTSYGEILKPVGDSIVVYNSVALDGLEYGTTYYYCAYIYLDSIDQYTYGNVKSFTTATMDIGAVDLGLSVKWASHNVGATKPEEYGGYYAWGETEEKEEYSVHTYKYYKGDLDSDDYNDEDEYEDLGDNISSTKYDVAHVKWGNGWRMPTRVEMKELISKCVWKKITINGVIGRLVTGPNGNSIFLPASGYIVGPKKESYDFDSASYWSSDVDYIDTHKGDNLRFEDYNSTDKGRTYSFMREWGCSVRPVKGY